MLANKYMQLQQFKVGTIITRTCPTIDGDARFIGDRFKYLGYEGLVFFGRFLNPKYIRDKVVAVGGTKWFDDNWAVFPENLYQTIKAENQIRIDARKVAKEQDKKDVENKDGKTE